MKELPDKLEQYILDHIDEEPEYLQKLSRDTFANMLYPQMLSGHLQGRLLKMLCRMINPERILEIGTFTGYSALCMAEALPEKGTIDTIEINDELETFIREHFSATASGSKINLIIGDALKVIPELPGTWDLAFIDGNKRYYPEYYNLIFDRIKTGGYIIADNVLWSGKVVEPADPRDTQTKGILEFNNLIAADKRVEKVIFPVRDGFTVIRKL
ncbi:O-methyltransferase [Saccharicrinis sp. FJH62]|uniref:O-methyltransferase n=1 Tax=Saccharicrinis sp. FJH62 TaxID=3344657 RepID=UPI0035D45E72